MHTQLYGSGFHSRPGFMDAVTIAVIPEPLQKAAAANLMGVRPRAGKHSSDSNLSSRSSSARSSSGKSSRSSRTTCSSRGSSKSKVRREQPPDSGPSYSHNDDDDEGHYIAPASQCPTEKFFDYRYGQSDDDYRPKTRRKENDHLSPGLARPYRSHGCYQTPDHATTPTSPSLLQTRTKRSQPRSSSPSKQHFPIPLEKSPHFTLVDLKDKQPQPRPSSSSPSFLTSVLKRLKLSSSQQQKTRRPPSDREHKARSDFSYAPERDPMYKGIQREPGRRLEGEVVVHRRRPDSGREQNTAARPRSRDFQSNEGSKKHQDADRSSGGEPPRHERSGNASGGRRQAQSRGTLSQDSNRIQSPESLGRGSGGSSRSRDVSFHEEGGPKSSPSSRNSSPRSHANSGQSSSSSSNGSHHSKPRPHGSPRQGNGGSSRSTKPRSCQSPGRGGAGAQCEVGAADPEDDDDGQSALFPTLSEMGMVRRVDWKGVPLRSLTPEDSISSVGRKRRRDREQQKAARGKFAELLRQRDIEEEKKMHGEE